ncbi:hypothetical protein HQ571_01920 [Candidatus Kuenenbacteria bacterium]|nr:hypothetical protein [Candidatus Kuenenbacteria bacterium]
MFHIQKIKTIAQICLIVFVLMSVVVPVMAADDDMFGVKVVGGTTGLGGEGKDLRSVIGKLINVALGFLGVIAVIIVLIGGFKYMTAGGSEEKAGDARKYIISGIIGLAIILAAYAITTFVISQLMNATTADDVADL